MKCEESYERRLDALASVNRLTVRSVGDEWSSSDQTVSDEKLRWMFDAEGPLYCYGDKSLYATRTDSRDRFGTPVERRFTNSEIEAMMKRAKLGNISYLEEERYWCAEGHKS